MKWIKRILLGILSLYLFALMLDVFISKSLLKSSLYNDELKTWSVINNDILDKDILVYGNKIYSPETCCFISRSLNSLFLLNNKPAAVSTHPHELVQLVELDSLVPDKY